MNQSTDYIPVLMDFFRDNDPLDFDLFTYDGGRYFLFLAAKAPFFKGNLSPTYVGETRYFYVRRSDQPLLTEYKERHLDDILNTDVLPIRNRVEVIYDVSNAILDKMFRNPGVTDLPRVSKFIAVVVDFITEREPPLKEIVRYYGQEFYTFAHSLHLLFYTVYLVRFLGIDRTNLIRRIGFGTFLHDIGKSRIDPNILHKSTPLTVLEFEEMKKHTIYGLEILKSEMGVSDPLVESIVMNHHERIDGSGYPHHKRGLGLYERTVGMIDMFDALTSERGYGQHFPPFGTLAFLYEHEGRRLDKNLLKCFTVLLGMK